MTSEKNFFSININSLISTYEKQYSITQCGLYLDIFSDRKFLIMRLTNESYVHFKLIIKVATRF